MTEPMFGALFGILFGAIFAVFFIVKGFRGIRSGSMTVMNLAISVRTMSVKERHVQLTGQAAKRRALFSLILGLCIVFTVLAYAVMAAMAVTRSATGF